jgi:hypothetical protein
MRIIGIIPEGTTTRCIYFQMDSFLPEGVIAAANRLLGPRPELVLSADGEVLQVTGWAWPPNFNMVALIEKIVENASQATGSATPAVGPIHPSILLEISEVIGCPLIKKRPNACDAG